MTLVACRCGAPAVEQVRGEMGPGDYWQDRMADPLPFPFGPANGLAFYQMVEIDDGNRDDRRIACTKCEMATGWSKGSFKRLGEDWNRCVGSPDTQP